MSTIYTAGLASIFGYAVFNGLLSKYPPSAVVPWALWAPAVAMASGWALLGQRPNGAELAGGGLLLVGVLVALRQGSGRVPTDVVAVEVATAAP